MINWAALAARPVSGWKNLLPHISFLKTPELI
jgi:hypothetical protein